MILILAKEGFVSLEEVEKAVKQAASKVQKMKAEERAFFMKATMPMLGLTVPDQRKLAKRGYSFSDQSAEKQAEIWTEIWHGARTHEAKMQAGFSLEGLAPSLSFDVYWALLQDWCGAINCWDQSDTLSGHVADLLERNPKAVWPVLEAWNTNADPWKRRQSLVGLFFYARSRTKMPPVSRVLSLVTARLEDDHNYVQKGLGWTLRECFNAYPEKTFAYLMKHAGDIRPDAFSAAVEKVSAGQKAEIKAVRKVKRKR